MSVAMTMLVGSVVAGSVTCAWAAVAVPSVPAAMASPAVMVAMRFTMFSWLVVG
jgi:hypothetical protein